MRGELSGLLLFSLKFFWQGIVIWQVIVIWQGTVNLAGDRHFHRDMAWAW